MADAIGRNREPVFYKCNAHEAMTAIHKGEPVNFKCPYQAKVMNTLDAIKRRIGRT